MGAKDSYIPICVVRGVPSHSGQPPSQLHAASPKCQRQQRAARLSAWKTTRRALSGDLWNGVEDPVAHPAQSKKALSIIGLNVEDHHLGSIEECKTAKEAWDLLEKTYKSKTNARKMQLRQELHSLKMKSEEGGETSQGCGLDVAFSVIEGVSTDEGLVDSGGSQHLTGDKSLFETLEMFGGSGREFTFGDKEILWAEGSGSVQLRCATPTGESLVTLQNVMYVPGVAANLISVSKATEVASVLFKENGNCELEVDGEVVLVARKVKGVYVINRAEKETCFLVKKPETAELWHRRLGHAGYENLAKMVQGDLVEGVGVKPSAFRALKTSVCEPCIMGKQTRLC
ncbi:hypothetical protein KFL_010700040 [Klebsormidium nitens]|uniref:Uncharacterized protein n=1 Tax=Klebsormidium nitens TaxID=105231 RepID=A0A1Y1ITE7_KLENI|nr:hypothetical protein KFL_010700040 [Klebsormidium nitens]|eukprot:GAQ92611.1 hypothetical protein KFL_010700040 [Klebsormidium nitens]